MVPTSSREARTNPRWAQGSFAPKRFGTPQVCDDFMDSIKPVDPASLPLEVIPPCAGEMSAQPTKGARLREKKVARLYAATDEVGKSLLPAL